MTILPQVLCAATAGATGAFAGTPGDLAMVRMQAWSHRFFLQKLDAAGHIFLIFFLMMFMLALDFDANGCKWWMCVIVPFVFCEQMMGFYRFHRQVMHDFEMIQLVNFTLCPKSGQPKPFWNSICWGYTDDSQRGTAARRMESFHRSSVSHPVYSSWKAEHRSEISRNLRCRKTSNGKLWNLIFFQFGGVLQGVFWPGVCYELI